MLNVVVNDTGAGHVQYRLALDDAAVTELGGADNMAFDDITSATGWDVLVNTSDESGNTLITVTKEFSELPQINELLSELGGNPPLFSLRAGDVATTTDDVTYDVGINLHSSGTAVQVSDQALTEVLSGFPVGFTQEELDVKFAQLDEPIAVSVQLQLPGEITETSGPNSGTVTALADGNGEQVTWNIPIELGATTQAEFAATSAITSSTTMLIRIAAMLGVIALVFLSYGLWVRYSRSRRSRLQSPST